MPIGILAGLATCALWGLTFVAPRAVAPFSAFDLTIARYSVFGLACAVAMLHPRFRPRGLTPSQVTTALLLGGLGYVGYFISVAFAVQRAGAALPPLIIGLMPVTLALIANWRDRSVPWRTLAVPLILIASGVGLVNWTEIGKARPEAVGSVVTGVAFATAALVIWVVYGLVNATAMRAAHPPDGLHWTGLQGIGAAIGSLLLLPLSSFAPAAAAVEFWRFLGWALLMGVAGSWFATWCWVVASRRLPLALASQLIVAETLFGLSYGFAFEGRWPTYPEWVGTLLQAAGVVLAIAQFTGRARTARQALATDGAAPVADAK
ncbi:DMT family transporter [Rhizobium giardinii]|uniref:DMT family transporter n=1 Tax=Rhizobium giardinii TaxID=56731 RepID=UPI000DD8B34F